MNFPYWSIALAALLSCPAGKAATTAADIGTYVDISSKNLNPPVYPLDAARACISGTTVIIVDVDKDGRHTGAIVEKSSRDPRLDQAALDASRKWRYNAATINGEPSAGRVRLPIDFNLNDDCWTTIVPDVGASLVQSSVEAFPVPWPEEVEQLGLSGALVLRARIEPDGAPASVDIEHSSGNPDIDTAAMRAASMWEYKPALLHGNPIRSMLLLPIDYGRKR